MSTKPFAAEAVTTDIPAVPLTVEGYSVLHQMMRFRWGAWRALSQSDRHAIAAQAAPVLAQMEQNSAGATPAQ